MASSQIPQDIYCPLGTPTQVSLYNYIFINLFLGCGGIITDSSGYLLSHGYTTQVLLYNLSSLQSVSRMWWLHHRFLRISTVSWVPQHRSYCIIHLFFNLFLRCGGIITDSSGYLLSPWYPNTGLTV